jgi:hypothetical protein
MIKIEKNHNFLGFFNVFAFGKLYSQVQGRANALVIARSVARHNGIAHIINHNNEIVTSDSSDTSMF